MIVNFLFLLFLFDIINKLGASNIENISENFTDSKTVVSQMYNNNFKNIDLYIFNSWFEKNENFKNLIHMIMLNNFKDSPEKNITLHISDIYQFYLFKKTIFNTFALKQFLENCDKKLVPILQNMEKTLIFSILPLLNKLNKATDDSVEYILKDFTSNSFWYETGFNKLLPSLRKYIIDCRYHISEFLINNISSSSENIEDILAKYNVFISSMIEIYFRTIEILKSDVYLKAMSICECFSKNQVPNLNLIIKTNNNINSRLNELSNLIYYNADKYNRLMNKKKKLLKIMFGDQICSITATQLTNFALKILFNINIIDTLNIKNKLSCTIFYLSNSNNKNDIDFKETRNIMVEYNKKTFPEFKTFEINLKDFKSYESVLKHIKIKIKMYLILTRDENTNNPLIFCSYKLIPTIIYDTPFTESFEKKLQEAYNVIKNVQKDITIKYENYSIHQKSYQNRKSHIYIDGNEEHCIYNCLTSNERMKEIITMRIKLFEIYEVNGDLCMNKLNLELNTKFYCFNRNNKLLRSKIKYIYLYPTTESIQKSADQRIDKDIKLYSFETYIYNPKIRDLREKLCILSDLVYASFDNLVDIRNVMIISSDFISNWFETNILYSGFLCDSFDIVPYKYVSSWMSYITFRSCLKNKIIFNGETIDLNENTINSLHKIIRRYELNCMASYPFYDDLCIEEKEFSEERSRHDTHILFWSDETNSKKQELEMKKIYENPILKEKFQFFFYKLEIIINSHKIGLGEIHIIRINSFVMRNSKILNVLAKMDLNHFVEYIVSRKKENLNEIKKLLPKQNYISN